MLRLIYRNIKINKILYYECEKVAEDEKVIYSSFDCSSVQRELTTKLPPEQKSFVYFLLSLKDMCKNAAKHVMLDVNAKKSC